MQGLVSNALPASLGVLSAAITPAVLVLATSSLIAATATRLGRVVDRTRRLGDEFEELARSVEGGETLDLLGEERALIYDQLRKSTTRARLMQRAMSALYFALVLFLATSVAIGIEAGIRWRHPMLPVAFGLGGVLVLFYASLLLLTESRIALKAIDREMEFVRRVGEHHAPAELRAARRSGWLQRLP